MKLSAHQEKVVSAFDEKDKDIPIGRLFMRVYGHDEWQKRSVREMQQKLAPIFADINVKLEGKAVIEPGELKRTYRYSIKRG